MLFENSRYPTRGIDAEIPPTLQLFLWNCINLLPEERNYLKVFELKPLGDMQQIKHTSEQPEYRKVYLIPANHPITAKIYVIDSETYSTMLLAEEY